MSKLTERAELLRIRLKEAGHRADGRLEHEVRGAAANDSRILQHLEHYLKSVDTEGLLLMAELEASGNVEVTAATSDMMTIGAHGAIHKGALIPEASLPSLLAPAHLGEAEDLGLLRPLRPRGCPEVSTQSEMAVSLDAALERLAERSTPATHIILPWNWGLAQWLLEHGGAMNLKTRHEMGTYRGVRVFRGPIPWPSQLAMVIALNHWIRVRLCSPPAETPQLHHRFRSEIRPPTPEEVAETGRVALPESIEGLPFQGDDLEAAIANKWRLFVVELFAVDEVDPGACECLLYRPAGEAAPAPRAQ